MHFELFQKLRVTVPDKIEKAVARADIVSIDRFDRRWARRRHVHVAQNHAGEEISLRSKVQLQMFPGQEMIRDHATDSDQDGPMENDKQREQKDGCNRLLSESAPARSFAALFIHEGVTLFPRGERANCCRNFQGARCHPEVAAATEGPHSC